MANYFKKGWNYLTSALKRDKAPKTASSDAEPTETTEPTETSPPPPPPADSQPNHHISNEVTDSKRLADAVKDNSTLLTSQTGPLPVYKIPLEEKMINIKGCKSFSSGKESPKANRTIVVLGATGAGKSTLINGMMNYILGVRWGDPYRFKLVDEGQSTSQAFSQTSEVTAYKIHHQENFKIDYSLTIVDTPGFGDNRGIERDREITDQLRNLFSDKHGVSEIDAVCFVAQASLARLTPTQKYVFDSILSIFGKDVAENIRILVTFADGQLPPVLEAINASGVPCPKTEDGLPNHFKFNNSALFADNSLSAADDTRGHDDDEFFDQMFWNMGAKSMKRFFVALNRIKTKSLTLTNEVLRERKQLENSVESLQEQVKLGLAKLEEIKETSEKLKEHEAEISRNENFEFEVTVTKPFQEDISGTGKFITNCQLCHFTCHHSCIYSDDKDKIYCVAMEENGHCRVCPGKCFWNEHFNQKYRWHYKEVKEKRTAKELKDKYKRATGEKMTVEGLIDKLKAEYDGVQEEVVKLIERSSKCLNRLKEIALKPNPLSTPEYIDLLIEGEKQEGKPGWNQRVQSLKKMKEKAEYLAKVEKGEDFFQGSLSDVQQCNPPEMNKKGNIHNKTQNISQTQNKKSVNKDQNTAGSYPKIKQSNTENVRGTKEEKAPTKSNQIQQKVGMDTNQDETETKTDRDKDNRNQDQPEAQDEPRTDPDPDPVKTGTQDNEEEKTESGETTENPN